MLDELAFLAFADPLDLRTWNEQGARAKVGDKIRALDLLGRHFGLWDKQPPHVDIDIRTGAELAESLRKRFERVVEAEAHPLPPEKLPRPRPESRKELPPGKVLCRRARKKPE